VIRLNRIGIGCLALALACVLAACAKTPQVASSAPAAPGESTASGETVQSAPSATESAGTWVFDVETRVWENEARDEDGTLLASVRYEYPVLTAHGSAVDPPPADAELPPMMRLACEEFNSRFAEADFERDFRGIAADALEDYDVRKTAGAEFLPFEEQTGVLSVYSTPEFVSVAGSDSIYLGGVHPFSQPRGVNFDLAAGEFVAFSDLTDDYDSLSALLREAVRGQIWAEGNMEDYYDSVFWSPELLANAVATFTEYGADIVFYEEAIAPRHMGRPSFRVGYEKFSALLNERGRRLLALPEETLVLGDFFEAQELWNYFDLTTMPCDTEGAFAGPDGEAYHLVTYRGLQTLDDLRALLERRFTDELIDGQLLPLAEGHYAEIGGRLCARLGDRGTNITRGEAAYEVELEEGGGKVIATVEVLDPDAAPAPGQEAGAHGFPVVGYVTIEYPFTRTENGARFSYFESIR